MRKAKKATKELLTKEQLEVSEYYRQSGGIVEFLYEQTCPEGKPFRDFIEIHHESILRAMWWYSFMYLCAARRYGKTWCLGRFCAAWGGMLSGMEQSQALGLYSGTLRQVGLIFRELEKAVDASPFLQSITLKGPKQTTDGYIWELKGWEDSDGGYHPGQRVEGYPLGASSGSSSSRGFGFPTLIIDEFQLVPESSWASIFPTTLTSSNPMEDVVASRRAREEAKRVKEDPNAEWHPPAFNPWKNRIILAGTAFWQFVAAHRKFEEYMHNSGINRAAKHLLTLLNGRYPTSSLGMDGRRAMMQVVSRLPSHLQMKYNPLQEENTPVDGDLAFELTDYVRREWGDRSYVAFQLPYTSAPDGWYQEKQLRDMVATMSDAEIKMELLAQWLADSEGPFSARLIEGTASNAGLTPETKGDWDYEYIMGVDPAIKNKLGIVILKLIDDVNQSGVQVVYARDFDVSAEAMGLPNQVRLLFNLAARFRPKVIVIDNGPGGGGDGLAQSMAEKEEPFSGAWGGYGKPILTFGNDQHKHRQGDVKNWLLYMGNRMVTTTNDRIHQAITDGKFQFACQLPTGGGEQEDIYYGIRELKNQMLKLVVKPTGDIGVKYDLPSRNQDATHIHDLWSALTLAFAAYLELNEGTQLRTKKASLPTGVWGARPWG